MKRLLTVTAVLEGAAGVALITFPSATASLVIGAPLAGSAALSVARVGGISLLALGVACRRARDAQSRAAGRLVAAILVYNLGAAVILGAAGLWSLLVGVALWPVVALHIAMAVWCIVRLLSAPVRPTTRGAEPMSVQ